MDDIIHITNNTQAQSVFSHSLQFQSGEVSFFVWGGGFIIWKYHIQDTVPSLHNQLVISRGEDLFPLPCCHLFISPSCFPGRAMPWGSIGRPQSAARPAALRQWPPQS